MLGQMKFRLDSSMAFKTCAGIFSWIDNKFSAPAAAADMQTAGPVARFTTGLTGGAGVLQTNARVWTGRKNVRDIRVALGAGMVPNETRPGNFRRRGQVHRLGRAGIEKHRGACDQD